MDAKAAGAGSSPEITPRLSRHLGKPIDLLWPAASQVETGDFRFYAALAHAAAWNSASSEEGRAISPLLAIITGSSRYGRCIAPRISKPRAALVSAEIARIEGRMLDAEHLYEAAIRSAHATVSAHRGVANEWPRSFTRRAVLEIADAYLREARSVLSSLGSGWQGSTTRSALSATCRAEEYRSDPSITMVTSAEQLDLATVIKVSQAVSGEIVLEKLVETLMRTAIVHAGAERGSLVLAHGDELRLVAKRAPKGMWALWTRGRAADPGFASRVDHLFVVRTGEPVLLDDALPGIRSLPTNIYAIGKPDPSSVCHWSTRASLSASSISKTISRPGCSRQRGSPC